MTTTRCERLGQIEIGIIEHERREYSALGSSVVGRNITGYTREDRNCIILTTWCGKTMLDCRCEIIDQYWNGSLVLMFRLPRGRFIIGFALGETGMLFRGELLDDCSDDDARRQAINIAQYFNELYIEDEAAFQTESTET